MEKIKLNILSIGVLSFFLFSCGDSFLDIESKTTIMDENFYRTIDDAEMALIGCYDGWQRTTSDGGFAFYVASEVMSDDCFGGTGNTDGRGYQAVDRFDIGVSSSDANLFEATWAAYYAGVFRCNTLLLKLDGIEWGEGNESIRNRIEGETRVLRAILYFDMVRLWGNIPLLTEPTADDIPQADPADVYALIVEDLKFGADNIPPGAYPKANANENDGRITPYAAKALLARVYLFYTGYYGTECPGLTQAQALSGLEDIIASNEYSLIEEFSDLWEAASSTPVQGEFAFESTYAGRGNAETVLAQKFNDTQNYNGRQDGNRWLVMMGMRNTNYSPYGKGWGACTVSPKLWSAFESGDKRRAASIIDIAGEGIESIYDIKDQREYTGYSNKKYTPLAYYDGTSATQGGAGNFQDNQSQDYIVVRYADVLLMAAELGSSNAQNYFDQIRRRAGLSSRTVTKENIMAERRFEFAFEGLRYWDLLRQGLDYAASAIAEEAQVLSGGNEDRIVISAENIKRTKGLSQIPFNQINMSNELVQNEGW